MSCPWSWISAPVFSLHTPPSSAATFRIPHSLRGGGRCFSAVHPAWLLLPHGKRSPSRVMRGTSLPMLGSCTGANLKCRSRTCLEPGTSPLGGVFSSWAALASQEVYKSSKGAPICASSGLLSANELQLPTRLICLLSLSFLVMLGKGKVTQSVSLVCSQETGKVLLLSSWRLTAVPSLPSL